jgi:CysZ protein
VKERVRDLRIGAGYLFRGAALLLRPGLRRYVVAPVLINTLLFAFGIHYAMALLDATIHAWLPSWLSWLQYVVWPLFAVVVFGLVFFTFGLAANLLGAPFNSYLADAVERTINQTSVGEGAARPIIRETLASIWSEARRIIYVALWSLPFIILSWLPGMVVPVSVLGWVAGAWIMALQYLDYPLALHGIHFAEHRRLVVKRRALAIGFGLAVMVLTLIPVLNFLAMPIAVAGATALWVEHLQGLIQKRNEVNIG